MRSTSFRLFSKAVSSFALVASLLILPQGHAESVAESPSVTAAIETQGFQSPYIIMTPNEIQRLPDEERMHYLGAIRKILTEAPNDALILAQGNGCGETQRQCEPSIFGENVCIPKHGSAKVLCHEKMKKDNEYTQNGWGSYFFRLQEHCRESKMPRHCKSLEDQRIDTFTQLRTH